MTTVLSHRWHLFITLHPQDSLTTMEEGQKVCKSQKLGRTKCPSVFWMWQDQCTWELLATLPACTRSGWTTFWREAETSRTLTRTVDSWWPGAGVKESVFFTDRLTVFQSIAQIGVRLVSKILNLKTTDKVKRPSKTGIAPDITMDDLTGPLDGKDTK